MKRKTRFGLAGAAVTAAVLGLWACAPAVTNAPPASNNTNNTNNTGNTTTPQNPVGGINVGIGMPSQVGEVKVGVSMPSGTPRIQSVLDTLDNVEVTVTGTTWSPALKATFDKAAITGGTAAKSFADVPIGAATVAAVAKNASGATLANASTTVTVAAGQAANATLVLSYLSGGVGATISVDFKGPGDHGAQQAGSTYVGQAVCMNCHNDVKAVFEKTQHGTGGTAWPFSSTVQAKGYNGHNNRKGCTVCHSTGGSNFDQYGLANMPIDVVAAEATATTPVNNRAYAMIGCESCHGPGSKHVAVPLSDIAGKKATITQIPSYRDTCVQCHRGRLSVYDASGSAVATDPYWDQSSQTVKTGSLSKKQDFAVNGTGAPEAEYMAAGSHTKLSMSPVAAVYDQSGGYTGGTAVGFSNSHKTLMPNGCVNCHMAAPDGAEKHVFDLAEASPSAIVNSCQKCHGTGFTDASITSYQAQTKMALAQLKSALIAYRAAFGTKFWLSSGTATNSYDVTTYSANMSAKPTLWDDSDSYLVGLDSASRSDLVNWTDQANWKDNALHFSDHQKIYNRAYWNYGLCNDEGSFGIHAPTYTQSLIRNSYNSLVQEFISKNKPASASFSLMSVK